MGGFIAKRQYFVVIDKKTGYSLNHYKYSTYEVACKKAQQLEEVMMKQIQS